MRKCLVVSACLGLLLLAGCNRCAMWDWYCPCDLIEGKNCDPAWCGGPCGPQPGQVVQRDWAVRADQCVPAPPPAMAAPPPSLPQPQVVEGPPAGGAGP